MVPTRNLFLRNDDQLFVVNPTENLNFVLKENDTVNSPYKCFSDEITESQNIFKFISFYI